MAAKTKTLEELRHKITGGFFLSSIHGRGDGAFCGERARGCRFVQLGLRLAEPPGLGAEGAYLKTVLPHEPKECRDHLAEECRRARGGFGDVLCCLNMTSLRLEWAMAAARCFLDAGGDLLELNAHGSYARYLSAGRVRAMVLPEHGHELIEWTQALAEDGVPLIVKLNGQHDRPSVLGAIARLEGRGLLGLHINVRNPETRRCDTEFARRVRDLYSGLLLASGYIRSAADARELFAVGVDAVGIGEPAIEDPGFIARLDEEHRTLPPREERTAPARPGTEAPGQ